MSDKKDKDKDQKKKDKEPKGREYEPHHGQNVEQETKKKSDKPGEGAS